MGPENNAHFQTLTAEKLTKIDFDDIITFPIIPVWKKRKTLIKYLMSLGLSRNTAVEDAELIKRGRKLCFSGTVHISYF